MRIFLGDMISGMYLDKGKKDKWGKVLESKLWYEVIIANWDYRGLSRN